MFLYCLGRIVTVSPPWHPPASLREGLEETLALQRLGIAGALYRTLRSTNAIENLNGLLARYTRNVKCWRDGDHEAERSASRSVAISADQLARRLAVFRRGLEPGSTSRSTRRSVSSKGSNWCAMYSRRALLSIVW